MKCQFLSLELKADHIWSWFGARFKSDFRLQMGFKSLLAHNMMHNNHDQKNEMDPKRLLHNPILQSPPSQSVWRNSASLHLKHSYGVHWCSPK